jgi:hypothetical protein
VWPQIVKPGGESHPPRLPLPLWRPNWHDGARLGAR